MRTALIIAIAAFVFGCSTTHRDGEHRPGADRFSEDLLVEEQHDEISVVIAGQVHSPGSYRLPSGTRLLEAIEKAGGFKEFSYTQGVFVAGEDGTTFKFDMREVTLGGKKDPLLKDGDAVRVPFWLTPQEW